MEQTDADSAEGGRSAAVAAEAATSVHPPRCCQRSCCVSPLLSAITPLCCVGIQVVAEWTLWRSGGPADSISQLQSINRSRLIARSGAVSHAAQGLTHDSPTKFGEDRVQPIMKR